MKIQTQIMKWLFNVDVESLQTEIVKLTNLSAQLQRDLTEAKSTICNIDNQKEELQSKHYNDVAERQTLLNDKEKLHIQLEEVTEKFEATEKLLSQEVKSYKLQLENKLKDVEKLIGQIDEKNLVIAYNSAKINELTECVSKLECTIKEQKGQTKGYAKNVSDLQRLLNESNRRFDEAQRRIKKYEESIKLVVDVVGEEYRSSLDAKDGLIQTVSNDLSGKSRLINKLHEDVSKLKREKIALQDEISQYKKNMKDLGNQLKTRSPEAKLIDSLYNSVERERISNNSLKERLKERNEKIITLQKEVDEKMRSYEKIKAEAIELGKEVKLLQMKIKV